MTTLVVILWVAVLIGMLLVLAMRPERTRHSRSELQRRGDEAVLRRERLLGDVLALKRIVSGLLLVGLVLLGIALWQAMGVVVSLGVWLVAGAVARWKPLHRQAMRLYVAMEPRLLRTVEVVPALGWLFRTGNYVSHEQRLESTDHLLRLVETAGHVLSEDQQEIIRKGIHWHETPISSVMTATKDIFSVKHGELLGPLVLDDLHKSGHDRFPVIRGTIDTVVGILDITDLLDVSVGRRSETAGKAMSHKVVKIMADDTLPEALALLRKSRQHMLIVTDNEGKTAGLVTLTDITRSLLGKSS